jgi:uncharacterized lipoprotein YmbA
MKIYNPRFTRLALGAPLTALTLILASCSLPTPQADTVRYFTLSTPAAGAAAGDAVAVRPVRMAGHLRNRDMAVRVSDNEVVYLEDVRWAEPLDEAITQLLRQRLRQIPGDAVVTVQVQRCELVRDAGNAVQVSATYAISGASGEARTGTFSAAPRQWDGKDPATLVSLLRDGVNELAAAIAETVEKN